MTIKYFFLLALLLNSVSVNAALVDRDWQYVGDSGITYDSVTQLEWLDLTYTTGYLNRKSKIREIARSGSDLEGFDGWRIANQAEIKSLVIDHYNLPYQSIYSTAPEDFAAANDFITRLGNTYAFFFNESSGYIELGGMHNTDVVVFEALPYGLDFYYPNEFFLVRNAGPVATPPSPKTLPAVPVPAAAWLFGSALLGLVGIKRKK